MVETAKHTQETLEFDETVQTLPKIQKTNIPTYPNISQHFPTKDIFPTLPQHPAARYAGAYAFKQGLWCEAGTDWRERIGIFDARPSQFPCVGLQNPIWLVVWNMNFIFPYIGNKQPNWRTYIFQRVCFTTNQPWFLYFSRVKYLIFPIKNQPGWRSTELSSELSL